jgi:hypothetical protein
MQKTNLKDLVKGRNCILLFETGICGVQNLRKVAGFVYE